MNYYGLKVDDFRNPEVARELLRIARQFGTYADFKLTLYNIVLAQGGLERLEKLTGLRREILHQTMSPHTKPHWNNLTKILVAVGFFSWVDDLKKWFQA